MNIPCHGFQDDDDEDDPKPVTSKKVENTAELIKKRLRSTHAPSNIPTTSEDTSEPAPDQYGLYVGLKVYGKKQKAEWHSGTIIEIQPQYGKRRYKVGFDIPLSMSGSILDNLRASMLVLTFILPHPFLCWL